MRSTNCQKPLDSYSHRHVDASRQWYSGKRVQKVSVEPSIQPIFQVENGCNVNRNTAQNEEEVEESQADQHLIKRVFPHVPIEKGIKTRLAKGNVQGA